MSQQSLLPAINACNKQPPSDILQLWLESTHVGFVASAVAHTLVTHSSSSSVFAYNADKSRLQLVFNSASPEERTRLLDAVDFRAIFPSLAKGWRDEKFDLHDAEGNSSLRYERSLHWLLGLRSYGVHLNGYVLDGATAADGGKPTNIKMWVGVRAKNKSTDPGKLDNIVGGGMSTSPLHCLYKEAHEEASIPIDVVKRARAVGLVERADYIEGQGYDISSNFVYDLELPPDFKPTPEDNEVEQFQLLTLDEVHAALVAGRFAPDPAVICAEFLLRHGYLDPVTSPDYTTIARAFRATPPLPMPTHYPEDKTNTMQVK